MSSPAFWCATFEACTGKSPRDSKRCARASESDCCEKNLCCESLFAPCVMRGYGAKGGCPGGSCRECAAAKRKCTHNCPGRLPTGSAKGGALAGLTPGSNSSTHDQEPAPNPPKPAARRPGRVPGPVPPDVGRKNLFPRPGGESARVAAEEASRHKTSKQQGQSRADAA